MSIVLHRIHTVYFKVSCLWWQNGSSWSNQGKLTDNWVVTAIFTQHLNGYGRVHVRTSIVLMKYRLSTRGLLRRRNMEMEDYNCVLCNEQAEETVEHLFINCTFAQDCWRIINLSVDPTSNPLLNLESLKDQLNRPFFYGSHHSSKLGYLDD
jgi:hypothetical protein